MNATRNIIRKVVATDDVITKMLRLPMHPAEKEALQSVHRALNEIAFDLSTLGQDQHGLN